MGRINLLDTLIEQNFGMKRNGFRLIVLTMVGSAGMAAFVLRLTGSLLLAFLTYSFGGAMLMVLLAFVLIWLGGRRQLNNEDRLAEWEEDRSREIREATPPKKDLHRKSG